ncbi:uncharacterized protein LOC131435019 [Malaya genurostris]|uniref:uncharacterized protein LOC131435019 n=1 Tax=Malaya genurostris TaxID=325434 RepID=UPI0026F39615|nr:uncharacterized protein LOC131435019 [Malaya genurostris]
MLWERPAEIPFPTVWHEFQGPDVGDTDNLVSYRVEDLTPNRFDDIVEHFLDHFLTAEPEYVAKGVPGDELARREIVDFWRWCFARRLTLVCYKEASRTIIGGILLNVKMKEGQNARMVESEKLKGIFASNEYLTDTFDVFGNYGVSEYLTACGMAVHRNYHGTGICGEMLRAQIPICKALGLKVISTNFTGTETQAVAAKVGFRSDLEMSYDELAKLNPLFTFPRIASRSTKVMSLVIK